MQTEEDTNLPTKILASWGVLSESVLRSVEGLDALDVMRGLLVGSLGSLTAVGLRATGTAWDAAGDSGGEEPRVS